LCLNSLKWWLMLVTELGYAWIDFRSAFLVPGLLKRSYLVLRQVRCFNRYVLEMLEFGWSAPRFTLEGCSLQVACLRDSPWCVTPNWSCPGQNHWQPVVDLKVHPSRQDQVPMPMVLHLDDYLSHLGLDVNCSWVLEIWWCSVRWN
jgi:hypothetical protein